MVVVCEGFVGGRRLSLRRKDEAGGGMGVACALGWRRGSGEGTPEPPRRHREKDREERGLGADKDASALGRRAAAGG